MKLTNNIMLTMALTSVLMTSCMMNSEDGSGQSASLTGQGNSAVSFDTYMRESANGNTRAGATGAINTDKLKTTNYGFGVFGYYTGKNDYAQNTVANFMYNQKVTWDGALVEAGYVTGWTYEPVKYWPNDVQNGAVDDQDNDQSNNQATGDGTHGGKLSFFAYAPYVELSSTDIVTTDGGITAINGSKTLSGGNSLVQNPTIEYTVPNDGAKTVDLLWGTYYETSGNVVDDNANKGKSYNAEGTGYEQAILQGYTLNADLTKQKTNGTVGFMFKHALSKVGGSKNTVTSTTENGLMIVLDIDNLQGHEAGGTLETYSGTTSANTQYNTKVTVKEVNIVGRTLVESGGKKPGDDGYTATYLKQNKGELDLATGQWTITTADNTTTDATQASQTTYAINENSTTTGTLSTSILEPSSLPERTQAGFESLPLGVLTTKQNVYQSEASPLVFIPGTYPELTITITYTVRTYDPLLGNAYSEITQRITKKVTFTEAVKLNKQYSLLMHLGLTNVKFTASVSEWERFIPAVSENDTPIDEEAVEHVYLPRNVGTSAEIPGTEATTITVGTKNYAIVIRQDGVDDGQTYFATNKPIYVTVYEVSGSSRTKVNLDGTTNSIYFLCHASNQHFHRDSDGHEMTYEDGVAKMVTDQLDINIVHAPVSVSLTINGTEQSVSTTIRIWPESYLPY